MPGVGGRDALLNIALSGAGGIAFCYLLFGRGTPGSDWAERFGRRNRPPKFAVTPALKLRLAEVRAMAAADRNEEYASVALVFEVLKCSLELVREASLEVSHASYRTRKELFENVAQWCRELGSCANKLRKLRKEGLRCVCKELGLDERELQEQIDAYALTDSNFFLCQEQLLSSLEASPLSPQPCDDALALRALERQTALFARKPLGSFTAESLNDKALEKLEYVKDLSAAELGVSTENVSAAVYRSHDEGVLDKQLVLMSMLDEEKLDHPDFDDF